MCVYAPNVVTIFTNQERLDNLIMFIANNRALNQIMNIIKKIKNCI